MKKFVIFGNCQALHITNILARNPEFNHKYELVYIKPIHTIKPEDISGSLEKLSQIDLFIYQPVSDHYRGTNFLDQDGISYLSTNRIINQVLKQDCLTISFPSIYFSGYLPNTIYVRGVDNNMYKGPAWDYHDANIINSYSKGFSLTQTLEVVLSDSLYSIDMNKKNIDESFKQLRTRELNFSLDIIISDYIQSNLTKKRLFHTFNHPSIDLLIFVASQILDKLGFRINNYDFYSCVDVLGNIYFPVHPSVYKNLDLYFFNPMNYLIRIDGDSKFVNYNQAPGKKNTGLVSAREAIEIFYRFYDEHEKCIELYRKTL